MIGSEMEGLFRLWSEMILDYQGPCDKNSFQEKAWIGERGAIWPLRQRSRPWEKESKRGREERGKRREGKQTKRRAESRTKRTKRANSQKWLDYIGKRSWGKGNKTQRLERHGWWAGVRMVRGGRTLSQVLVVLIETGDQSSPWFVKSHLSHLLLVSLRTNRWF